MSADYYTNRLILRGKLESILRLAAEAGREGKINEEEREWPARFWFEKPSIDEDGKYVVFMEFAEAVPDYRFSLRVAKAAMDKFPDIEVWGEYLNDQDDEFGGLAYRNEDGFPNWYVEPDDWKAFLAGDYRNTSMGRRRMMELEQY
jgi:hypothetical protein